MNVSSLSLNDLLTLAVALYGAIVASVLGIFQIKQYRREVQRRIVFFCDMTLGQEDSNEEAGDIIKIRAVNDGQRTLEIVAMGILHRGEILLSESFDEPKKLEPGTSVSACLNYDSLLGKIEGITEYYARDAAGNVYFSPVSEFTKDQIRLLIVYNATKTLVNVVRESDSNVPQILDQLASDSQQQIRQMEAWAAEQEKEQQAFDDYYRETGTLHPKLVGQINQITDENEIERRRRETTAAQQAFEEWRRQEEEWQ